MDTLAALPDNLLLLNLLNTKVEACADLVAYIQQMPGLKMATDMGRKAKVTQYLTVVEMCDTLGVVLNAGQNNTIDNHMAEVAEVMMMSPQTYRVSTIGGCSYQVREYPGCLFPMLLNILSIHHVNYDHN